ncbi:MAG TPA: hypothetical protein VJT76_06700 [Gaiella sp.]|nr:hypothetical protein [Gaiella sp.]
MTEQDVTQSFVVSIEAFGERRSLEGPGGTREDLRDLEDGIGKLLRRHQDRVRTGPHADRVADADVEDEFTPGHPGPSTGHS